MKKFSKEWWIEWFKTSTIRAIYTFCQGLLGMAIGDELDLIKLDWKNILLTCLIMAGLSYAKSFVVGVPEIELANYKIKEIK